MLFRVNWLKCICSYQVLCKITYISPWILILDEANSLSKMMIVMTCMFANIPKSTSCECTPYIILTLKEAQQYTIHTFTQLWQKKLRQDIIITQHYIKHNHESGSLSWLLYIYLTESFAMYPQNHRISNDTKRNSWGQFLVYHQSIKVAFVLIDKFEDGK